MSVNDASIRFVEPEEANGRMSQEDVRYPK